MSGKRNIVVLVAACLFIFTQPLCVFADRCDDVVEEASQTFDAAMAASQQKEYAEAVELMKKLKNITRKLRK